VMGTPIASGPTKAPELTVRQLGIQMMDSHAAALLVIGVILTVSLLGAIVLASSDNSKSGGTP
jgi:NADH:ubiquinone oxidoreductase subunit 6 (subunit J)